MTTKKEIREQIAAMWAEMRADGEMVIDRPKNKLGMPWALPYEGVAFPVGVDGSFILVTIPVDEVERFAEALVAAIPRAIKLEQECDAEIAAHEAINKAKGEE